jgi:EpsI family protein
VQLILPNQLNTWHKEANVIGEPVPDALYVARAYQNAQHLPLILNVTYFINSIQTYKNKDFIVNSPLWSLHQTKLRKIPLDNQEIKVVERIYTKNNHHRLVWDFYLIHGEVIPNKHAAQVKDNIRSFITQKRNSSYISIECDFETTVEQARHAMADFCQNLLLNINSIVPPAIKLN